METYLSDEAIAFLWSVLLGGVLGAVFDVFRIIRIFRRKSPWLLVFFEDLLFSAVAAVATAYVLSRIHYGQVRWFLLLGQGLGFLVYYATVGSMIGAVARLLRKFFVKFLKISKKTFIFLKKCSKISVYHFERRQQRREKKSHHRKTRQSKAHP